MVVHGLATDALRAAVAAAAAAAQPAVPPVANAAGTAAAPCGSTEPGRQSGGIGALCAAPDLRAAVEGVTATAKLQSAMMWLYIECIDDNTNKAGTQQCPPQDATPAAATAAAATAATAAAAAAARAGAAGRPAASAAATGVRGSPPPAGGPTGPNDEEVLLTMLAGAMVLSALAEAGSPVAGQAAGGGGAFGSRSPPAGDRQGKANGDGESVGTKAFAPAACCSLLRPGIVRHFGARGVSAPAPVACPGG